jgi:hypothetical protein
LNQGSAAITAQGEAIGVFSDETIMQLSEASDAIKKFQNIFTIGFGVLASKLIPITQALGDFAEELTLVVQAVGALGRGNFGLSGELFKLGAPGAATRRRLSAPAPAQPKKVEAAPFISEEEQQMLVDEKKKQEKSLYDEELYTIKEEAKLEASRDKTLFDRLMRDAEFTRDEKKRILQLERDTALKNREAVMRGIESAGPLLDRVRAAAERMGDFRAVRDIDRMRQEEQRRTDVQLLDQVLSPNRFRSEESIAALTQVEGESQRMQNMELVKSVLNMQGIVQFISEQIDNRLGVPILRSAN